MIPKNRNPNIFVIFHFESLLKLHILKYKRIKISVLVFYDKKKFNSKRLKTIQTLTRLFHSTDVLMCPLSHCKHTICSSQCIKKKKKSNQTGTSITCSESVRIIFLSNRQVFFYEFVLWPANGSISQKKKKNSTRRFA